MKTEITSLDLRFLVPELKEALLDGRFRKIYQYGTKSKQFLFAVHTPEKGNFLLYTDRDKVFLTEKKKEVPEAPPSFCMFLRKHLMNARIRGIRQHGFDRILEIITDSNRLVFEFFPPGNVILCDSMGNIIMPLEVQKWKDRAVRPKVPYKYPPAVVNPFELDFTVLQRSLARSEKGLGAFVATAMGLGAVYGTEVVERAGLDPKKPSSDMNLEEVSRLHNTVLEIGKMRPKPCICEGMVTPFPLKGCRSPQFKETFSQALDEFFSEQALEVEKEEEVKVEEAEKARIERIAAQQDVSREKWLRIEKESKEAGDLIYAHHSLVKGALEGVRKARDAGISWEEIKARVKEEGTPEAEAVKEIREKDGIIVMELEGKEVEIDIRQSVEENAARHYEDAKWARKKLGGLVKAKEELVKVAEKPEIPEEVKPEKPPEKPKRKRAKWYEKYKWFISSEGFLVVAGRNAEQNDTLLAKHAYSSDWVFHADIPGAAFVVIQGSGKEAPEQTKREAAEFAAANSKAWARGLGVIDIFSALREQVSKPGGMPKGSWVFSGEREWYRKTEVKLSIGAKVEEAEAKVVYGPVMAVRKNSDYFVTIIPGGKSARELAREVKNSILIKASPEHKALIEKIPLDELEKAIPSGMGGIVEFG